MKARIVILFLRVISIFPLWLIHSIGFVIGNILFLTPSKLKIIANKNLQACFPELDHKKAKSLLRRTLIENSKTALEFGYLWFRQPEFLLKKIVAVKGADILDDNFSKNDGIILAAPHLGQWEIIGLYCAERYPSCYLYKKPKIAQLEKIMIKARQRTSAKTVPTDTSGIKKMFQALRQGMLIGILPDQDPSSGDGVFAPFFGISAKTMVLLSRFAAKTNSPVFLTYAERLSYGRGFKLHFKKIEGDIYSKDLTQSTTELNKVIEAAIRQIPSQYQWTYKRFKSRPEGEEKFY